jgi:hypothetical protein
MRQLGSVGLGLPRKYTAPKTGGPVSEYKKSTNGVNADNSAAASKKIEKPSKNAKRKRCSNEENITGFQFVEASRAGIETLQPTSNTLDEQLYCAHSATINQTLQGLHAKLRTGVHGAQLEIDRYLFAAGPLISSVLSVELFILPVTLVPRFENLPDLSHMLYSVLCLHNTDNSIAVQFMRQCMPLKRRTKRAQRDIFWSIENNYEMRTFVRCMYGMLFGLYPTCSKFTHFQNRVALNAILHHILVSQVSTTFC